MTFELEQARAEIARHRENSARLAKAYSQFETTGQGSLQFEERVDFGMTFIEQPFVSYGCEIDLDALAEALGLDDDVTPTLPLSTGFVTDWDIDDRGFYTGAWVAATVYDPTMSLTPEIEVILIHHFTFEAIGLKDIPLDVNN